MRRLVLGLDALARLREAAGGPALPAAAALAGIGGADAVRLGLSEDLQGVTERDLRDVAAAGAALELRMAPIPSLVKAALEARPERVVLASSASGAALPLDFRAWGNALAPTLRTLEAGLWLYGNDMDESIYPVEAGLKWTVKFKKPFFFGKKAIEQMVQEGPRSSYWALCLLRGVYQGMVTRSMMEKR